MTWTAKLVGSTNHLANGNIYEIRDQDNRLVAEHVYENDARLIAEAPELLAALEVTLGWLSNSDVGYLISHKFGEQAHYQKTLAQARDAIAKATGEN